MARVALQCRGFPARVLPALPWIPLVFSATGAGAVPQSAPWQCAQGGVCVLNFTARVVVAPTVSGRHGPVVQRLCARLGRSRMRVGIVVGLAAEARIARRLGLPVGIGGGTASGAQAAAQALIRQGRTGLISFGLAGGLDPTLRPGALVVPGAVVVNDERYATDTTLSQALGGPTPHVMLGANAIVASVADKNRLRERTGAA